jgi:hypothetical protein
MFYGHLATFTAIWYILWPFGIFLVIWSVFPIWYIVERKIWQPCSNLTALTINHDSKAIEKTV